MPKISVGESFTVALNCGSEKVWIGGGVSRFSAENFCTTVPKTSPRNPSVIQVTFGIENCWGEERGRVSGFSVEIVMSHNAETICRENLLCCVSENFR